MTTAAPTRRAPRWRGRLARAALCLLLGAVTTVGVAWWAAVGWDQLRGGRHYLVELYGEGQGWEVLRTEHSVLTSTSVWFFDGTGDALSYLRFDWHHRTDDESERSFKEASQLTFESLPVDDIAGTPLGRRCRMKGMPGLPASVKGVERYAYDRNMYGWPLRALADTEITVVRSDGSRTEHERDGVWLELGEGAYLPILPRWGGLILDTLLYAAAWWIMLAMPGAVKRWRRKRRGACIECGYDLRGLLDNEKGTVVCPECGR